MFSRYYRRNPFSLLRLYVVDLYLNVFRWIFRRRRQIPLSKNRILLVNQAHLGDVVISTAIVRRIWERLPNVEIGFLAGTWAKPILEGHPGLWRAHYIDMWQLNRSKINKSEKKSKFEQTARTALKEVDESGYDIVIFLNQFEPSIIGVLKKIKVGYSIGYNTAGEGPLLDKSYSKGPSDLHEVEYQALLLESILGGSICGEFKPWLPVKKSKVEKNILVDKFNISNYVVLHPGTGALVKEWPLDNWRVVLLGLIERGINVVLTGNGEREMELAKELTEGVAIINVVNELNFDEYVQVVSVADCIIAAESLAGHVASAFDVPTIIIAGGFSELSRWKPLNPNVRILTRSMSCSPCYSRPCSSRPCILDVTPDRVLSEFGKLEI